MAGASKKVGQVANRIATATQSVFKSLFQQPQPAPSPTAAGAPNAHNTVTAGDTPTTGAKGVVSPVNVVLPAAARSATTAAGANTTPQPVGVGVIDVVSPTMTSAHGSGVASDAESQTGSSFIPSTAVADVPKVWLFGLSCLRRMPISVGESGGGAVLSTVKRDCIGACRSHFGEASVIKASCSCDRYRACSGSCAGMPPSDRYV